MKLSWFASYILVYLLTHSHWNLVVPVKAGEEGSGAEGTAADGSSALASTESDPSGVEADHVASEADASTLAEPANTAQDNQVPENLRGLKPFKVGADGNPVLMEDNEYLSDDFMGTRTYAFKPEVPCVLVRFNNVDVWKTNDHSIEKPKSVTLDGVSKEVTVRDKEKAVHFRMDENKVWKHVVTMSRERRPKVLKTADSTDANQASSVPSNEAKETGDAGSTDANQAEKSGSADGSGESNEQSKGASAESGGTGTTPDSDTSGQSCEAGESEDADASAKGGSTTPDAGESATDANQASSTDANQASSTDANQASSTDPNQASSTATADGGSSGTATE